MYNKSFSGTRNAPYIFHRWTQSNKPNRPFIMKNSVFKSYALPPAIGVGITLVVSFVLILSVINHSFTHTNEHIDQLKTQNTHLSNENDELDNLLKQSLENRAAAHQESEWLARMLISETNRTEEMEYIAWVARNRVENPRFPNTYQGVIQHPYAFSAFNYNMPHRTYFSTILFDGDAQNGQLISKFKYTTHELRETALQISYDVMFAQHKDRPFSEHVTHFYSPVSMSGGLDHRPSWAHVYNEIDVPSVEDNRFQFFESHQHYFTER